MTLMEWVDENRGEQSRTAFLRLFAKECGVSFQTLQYATRGTRIKLVDKAEAISKATNRAVSVKELCGITSEKDEKNGQETAGTGGGSS